jgi:hypothetical protein
MTPIRASPITKLVNGDISAAAISHIARQIKTTATTPSAAASTSRLLLLRLAASSRVISCNGFCYRIILYSFAPAMDFDDVVTKVLDDLEKCKKELRKKDG